jgi:hypothetical protein
METPDGPTKQQKRGHYAKADDADPIRRFFNVP